MNPSRFVAHSVVVAAIVLWALFAAVGLFFLSQPVALDPLTIGPPGQLILTGPVRHAAEVALSPVSWLLLPIAIAFAVGAEARWSRVPVDDRFVTAIGVALVIAAVGLIVLMAMPPYWTPCWLPGHPTGCLTLPLPVIPVVLVLLAAIGLGLMARRRRAR